MADLPDSARGMEEKKDGKSSMQDNQEIGKLTKSSLQVPFGIVIKSKFGACLRKFYQKNTG